MNKLKKIRFEKNLTQMELAEMAGCSYQHISNIENGKVVPNIKMCLQFADYLSVDINEMFYLIDDIL